VRLLLFCAETVEKREELWYNEIMTNRKLPHRAGWCEESYDSTDEKTACGVQAGIKAIKSKGMVSKCARGSSFALLGCVSK